MVQPGHRHAGHRHGQDKWPIRSLGSSANEKLFAQVCQDFFNSLHFLLQLDQIGFQFSNPFGLRLEPALEMAAIAIAASPTVALTAAFLPALACVAEFSAAAAFLVFVRIPTATHRLTPSYWKTVSIFLQEIILSLAVLSDIDPPRMQMVQLQVGLLIYVSGLRQGLTVAMLGRASSPSGCDCPGARRRIPIGVPVNPRVAAIC